MLGPEIYWDIAALAHSQFLCGITLGKPLIIHQTEDHFMLSWQEVPANHGITDHDIAVPSHHAATTDSRYW